MSDGYERFEDERHNGGAFLMGVLTGTALGVGLGLLFAPKSGSELRSDISGRAERLARQASERYQAASETASDWAEKGRERSREVLDKAKDAVARGTDEAERYVREAAGAATSTLRRG